MEHAENDVEGNGKAKHADIWADRKLPSGNYDFAGTGATAEDLSAVAPAPILDGIERQVKKYPGRTMLIVTSLGFLIGRALRRR